MQYSTILLVTSLVLHITQGSVDEYMSCDRMFENKRSARLLDLIPCDMAKKSYCEFKGAGYPEVAIWRFKEENRALMRRLYGDSESAAVYREMRSTGNSPSSSHQHGLEETYRKARPQKEGKSGSLVIPNLSAAGATLFSSMEYNIRLGSGLAAQMGSRTVPSRTSHPRVKLRRRVIKKKASTTPDTPSNSDSQANSSPKSTGTAPPTDGTKDDLVFNQVQARINPETEGLLDELPEMSIIDQAIPSVGGSHADPLTIDSDTLDSTLSELLADVDFDNMEHIMEELMPKPTTVSSSPTSTTPEAKLDANEIAFSEHKDRENLQEEKEYSDDFYGFEDNLYLESEVENEINYSGTSVSACEVTEEVLSPYWANNTRGQTLALLNIHSFEQYIHMEICKYEHEEMMCRRGCKCEQQYRLHRLLAYDPSNECRGIFSDWFRFPSFCVCKCYNVMSDGFLRHKPSVMSGQSMNSQKQKLHTRSRGTKRAKHLDNDLIRNIPAILPYEAKLALLRDIQTSRQSSFLFEEEDQETVRESQTVSDYDNNFIQHGRGGKDGTTSQNPTGHFLYGNMPVVEFQPPEGSMGSNEKIPRR